MRLSLSFAIVIVATLLVFDLTYASNVTNGEKLEEASSLGELKLNYLNNETEKGWQDMGEC